MTKHTKVKRLIKTYQFCCSFSQPVCHFLGILCSLVQSQLTSHFFHDVILNFNLLQKFPLSLFSQGCDLIIL